jgi:hypothetical protein
MSLRDDIAAATRSVVTALGETWAYRRLTSGPAAETRTYGSWTDMTAHVSFETNAEGYGEQDYSVTRQETAKLRVTDALTRLQQGDQVRAPDGATVWSVVGVSSSGVGTRGYQISRSVPLRGGPDRGGEV